MIKQELTAALWFTFKAQLLIFSRRIKDQPIRIEDQHGFY